MANVLLDILRSMAVGAAADKAREKASPYVDDALQALQPPQQAMTEGARMIDGYPSMSSGLEAITAPYQPNRGFTAEAADPAVVQQMVQDAYNEQMLRQSEVDADIAAENAANAAGVQDFVRQAGSPRAADLPSEEELMTQLDPAKMQAEGITPQKAYELSKAAGAINLVPEIKRVVEETGDESLWDTFTAKLKKGFSDERTLLGMAMAFNGLRYRPSASLDKYAQTRIAAIDEARANKESAVAAAEQLKKMGYGNMADYVIKNPKLAPKLMEAAAKRQMEAGEYVSGSGKDIMEKYGITGLNPSLPYRYNTRTKKIEAVGGGGVTVSTGGDALAKAIYGDIGAQRKTFVEEGIASRGRLDAYNRIGNLLKSTDQGRFAQTKQDVRKILETVGLGGAIDLDQYQNATELQAATNQLVAEELRANKGPQTDFDARFAQSYIPNIQNPAEANKAMVKFGQSKAEGQAVFGKIANKLRSSDPNVEEQMANLNDLALSFNNVIFAPNGTPLYFVDWVNANRGADPLELMTEWVKKVNQSQMGM